MEPIEILCKIDEEFFEACDKAGIDPQLKLISMKLNYIEYSKKEKK